MLKRSFVATVLAALALSVSGLTLPTEITPPGLGGTPYLLQTRPSAPLVQTDTTAILDVVTTVDQKSGVLVDELPNQPVVETVVVAKDGRLTGKRGARKKRVRGSKGTKFVAAREEEGLVGRMSSGGGKRRFGKRGVDDYRLVFSGTGTARTDRDASIQGTAYLTHTLVSNATYNVEACLDFCSRVQGCVFANLFYEFNNFGLDFEAREKTNLKCAVYGDVHSALEKTNFGNQQSYPAPAPLIYVQHSSGYALKTLEEPGVPRGYELVYEGEKATEAGGYLGFVLLDKYDVDACARECNTHASDVVGGSCQFFNIWRAVVNDVPTTYTCALYYAPTDASTATFPGSGPLKVTFSRGYKRTNLIADSSFETPSPDCSADDSFCLIESTAFWLATSPPGGLYDAVIIQSPVYARPAPLSTLPASNSAGLLGSAIGTDALPGTLTYVPSLATKKGDKVKVALWVNSAYSGPVFQKEAWFEVVWNGLVVYREEVGFGGWKEVLVDVSVGGGEVRGEGKDVLAIRGGKAPAWVFVDDVSVWVA